MPSTAPVSSAPPTGAQSQGASGVEGRAMVDGGCPVERENSPCPTKPLAARLTAVSAATGVPVGSTTSDADGRFRMALAPGSYRLDAVNLTGAAYPRGSSVDIVVNRGSYASVTVMFDSGIQ